VRVGGLGCAVEWWRALKWRQTVDSQPRQLCHDNDVGNDYVAASLQQPQGRIHTHTHTHTDRRPIDRQSSAGMCVHHAYALFAGWHSTIVAWCCCSH